MDKAFILKKTMTLQAFRDYVCYYRRSLVPCADKLQYSDKITMEVLGISNALGGECGELQNIIKKIVKNNAVFHGSDDLREKFVLEAGDVLHYLISLTSLMGYSLEEIMAKNVMKLDERHVIEERRLDEKRQALLAEASAQ